MLEGVCDACVHQTEVFRTAQVHHLVGLCTDLVTNARNVRSLVMLALGQKRKAEKRLPPGRKWPRRIPDSLPALGR